MDDTPQPAEPQGPGALGVGQLVACGIAALLGLGVGIGTALDRPADSWPWIVLGLVGVALLVPVWRSRPENRSAATYGGGVMVPILLIVVAGPGLVSLFALVVLVATLVGLTREAVAARR